MDDLSAFRSLMRERGVYQRSFVLRSKAQRARIREQTRKLQQAKREGQLTRTATIEAVTQKLAALRSLSADSIASCPVSVIYNGQPCRDACRCGGTGFTTVAVLVDRYQRLLEWLA